MTTIAETPLARLETENRLINGNVKEPGAAPGSFLYRGELALILSKLASKPTPPPELKAEQVLITAQAGKQELPFYACQLSTFASLKPLTEVLGDTLGATGKYFVFCSNLPRETEYSVKMGAATFYVFPLEKKSTVFNELLTLLEVEPDDVKKKGLGAKLDFLTAEVGKFNPTYEQISYERGLELMSAAVA